jgi:hypothetical protein
LSPHTRFRRYRGRQVPFSSFARPDSFSVISRPSCAVSKFCAPRIVFGGAECVRSRFYVLRSRTRFRWYSGPRAPFSRFALPNSFSAGGTRGVGSRFHVLRARNRFQRNRGRRVSFSCFARPHSFSTVPKAGPIFMVCAPELVFNGTEGVGSLFHSLRSRTRFRRYRGSMVPFSRFALPDSFSTGGTRGRRVPFSCFAHSHSFSALPRASGLVFMFCAPAIVFGGTEGRSNFHGLSSRTRFQRYRGRRIPFSYFVLSDSFSTVPRASGRFFVFCAPGLIWAVLWASGPVFTFCAPGLVFVGTGGDGSRVLVLRTRTRFRRYRGRRVSFPCFVLPDSFLPVPSASVPIFIFCAPGLVFDGTKGVGSLFHVLRSRTRYRRYHGIRVPLSRFALPNSFSAVLGAFGPVFLFCAPRIFFDGSEGVGSRIHVLRARTRFQRYRGRRVSFSCFARPRSFSAVPRAGPVFMVCDP